MDAGDDSSLRHLYMQPMLWTFCQPCWTIDYLQAHLHDAYGHAAVSHHADSPRGDGEGGEGVWGACGNGTAEWQHKKWGVGTLSTQMPLSPSNTEKSHSTCLQAQKLSRSRPFRQCFDWIRLR